MAQDDFGIGCVLTMRDAYSTTAQKAETTFGRLEKGIGNLGAKAFVFNQIAEGARNLEGALDLLKGPGEAFDSQMHELSAITGVTGAALDKIGDKARALALDFGGTAADAVESYKQVLSKLGPDIAKNPAALDEMGRSIQTLSKGMSGDVIGATQALTTSMNIYAGSLTDPIEQSKEMTKQANVMAAAAQIGSAEVVQIGESVKVAGLAASNAGVSFEELNSLIQIMGKGAVYGSEAGTALRNSLAIMSQGDYMPKQARAGLIAAGVDIQMIGDATIPVKQRLIELSKIQGDAALVSEVFGRENSNAARVLFANLGVFDQWTAGVTGTNSAYDQAAVVMDSFSEKMGRWKAKAQDYAITIFDASSKVLPFMMVLLQGIAVSSSLAPAFLSMGKVVSWVTGLFRTQAIATAAVAETSAAAAISTTALGVAEGGAAAGGIAVAAGSTVAAGGLGTMAAAAWAALLPFLPIIAAIALVGAGFWVASKSVDMFAEVASGAVEPANGLEGGMQALGAAITVAGEAWSSFDGKTFTFSESTKNALEKMGLLEAANGLGTYVVRFKAMWDGIGEGLLDLVHLGQRLWGDFVEAFRPVTEQFEKWGITLGAAPGQLETFVEIGRYVAYGLLVLFSPVIAMFAFMALTIALIAAPFILVYTVAKNAGNIADWFAEQWGKATDYVYYKLQSLEMWFNALPGRIYDAGANIVTSLLTGIQDNWGQLADWMVGAISGLPFGDRILTGLGINPPAPAPGDGSTGPVNTPTADPDAAMPAYTRGANAIADRGAAQASRAVSTNTVTERETKVVRPTFVIGAREFTGIVKEEIESDNNRYNGG